MPNIAAPEDVRTPTWVRQHATYSVKKWREVFVQYVGGFSRRRVKSIYEGERDAAVDERE